VKPVAAAIAIEEVVKQYGTGRATALVLDRLDLVVDSGEFIALMGPSGSGKSTLLNLIAGLDRPTSGRVWIGEQELAALSDDARSDLRLRSVGLVFQSFNLFPGFTAEENVIWPLEFLGVRHRAAHDRVRAALAQVELGEAVYQRRPAELSGGEQQRVAIARALVTEPTIVLADEPTGNLDSQTGQTILALLSRLNRERQVTIVLVTHDALAASRADRVLELRDGRLGGEGGAPARPHAGPATRGQ
jgi:putative ABC transport system ATP-binding protein